MQHFSLELHLNTRKDKDKLSDRLLKACIQGDRKAQRKLYEQLAPKMFPVCLRYMNNREMAEDVMQDGFVTLFSKLDSYSGTGSFEGWARKIFAELPPGFRTVFNMYVIEGYSHKEIADELGISENTSRSQLQRARVILQKKILEKQG